VHSSHITCNNNISMPMRSPLYAPESSMHPFLRYQEKTITRLTRCQTLDDLSRTTNNSGGGQVEISRTGLACARRLRPSASLFERKKSTVLFLLSCKGTCVSSRVFQRSEQEKHQRATIQSSRLAASTPCLLPRADSCWPRLTGSITITGLICKVKI
jgi:hypothetical protein